MTFKPLTLDLRQTIQWLTVAGVFLPTAFLSRIFPTVLEFGALLVGVALLAKLGFFVIHEKVRVKRTYGIQYLTRNHQVGACDETDFNRMFRMVEQSVSAEAQSG